MSPKERNEGDFYLEAAIIVVSVIVSAVLLHLAWSMVAPKPLVVAKVSTPEVPAKPTTTSQYLTPVQMRALTQSHEGKTSIIITSLPQTHTKPEYNVYHPTQKPKPAPTAAEPAATSFDWDAKDDETVQARAAATYTQDYCYRKYKIGDSRPVPGSVQVYLTSSTPEGGWGKHTVEGEIKFTYYDMGGKIQKASRKYIAHTQPTDKGTIKVIDVAID